MAAGAIPVIVDVDPNNYCLDPKAAEKAITPKTKAIIPVHLGSNMADMDAIMALAEKYDLVVIEDCAHAHGAKWNGRAQGRSVTSVRSHCNRPRLSPRAKAASCYAARLNSPRKLPRSLIVVVRTRWEVAPRITSHGLSSGRQLSAE